MHRWILALVISIAPTAAAAQSTAGLDPATGLPLPSIGLPLPSLGLPHPPSGLPAIGQAVPRTPAARPEPRPPRRPRNHGAAIPYPMFVSPYLWGAPASPTVVPSPAAPAPPGRVFIDAQPEASAQLFIDGYYVGTPADHPDGIELPAGPHALEIRAPGFDAVATSLQIAAGRAITYRAALAATSTAGATVPRPTAPGERHAEPAAADPAGRASGPATFYMIPGCYMGNVAPEDAGLPAGCDPAKAVTVRP